jgi:hypothetical protein
MLIGLITGTTEERSLVMNRRIVTLTALLMGMSILVSGCVAAVAAGVAGGAGGYRWVNGKLTFTTPHGISECRNATLSAFKELDLVVVSQAGDRLAGRIKGRTAMGDPVRVDLEPQASNITKIDIRVGFWGTKEKEKRIADAIQRNLR